VHQAPGIPHALSGRHYAQDLTRFFWAESSFNDSGASRREARTAVLMVRGAKRRFLFEDFGCLIWLFEK